MRTAVKLHFPVLHVPFVLSAELRPWFICSRKEELLRKRAFPCILRQINAKSHPKVPAEDMDGITKTDDSHTNVSSLLIFIICTSPSVCRTSALYGQGKTESSQRSEWVWSISGSHTVNFNTPTLRKHVDKYQMAVLWCLMSWDSRRSPTIWVAQQ